MRLSNMKPRAPQEPGSTAPHVAPVGRAGAAANAPAARTDFSIEAVRSAQAALRSLPDFDEARVDALRIALAEGRIPFDAGRLAELIQRFHGGRE
ncbi:Anti-sigma-28 factor [Burkholderia diffusa]|nr:Anti-sigma-28 factor [Burkholderia diffusa]